MKTVLVIVAVLLVAGIVGRAVEEKAAELKARQNQSHYTYSLESLQREDGFERCMDRMEARHPVTFDSSDPRQHDAAELQYKDLAALRQSCAEKWLGQK